MDFILTNAGVAAANAAGTGGPKIEIVAFRAGSGSGYTPNSSTTSLSGAILFSGGISNYYPDSAGNAVVYELEMPATIGPFAWGEIGLYLASGVLFAVGARAVTKDKELGSVTRIQAKFVLSGGLASINFPQQNLTIAKLLELNTVTQLNRPLSAPGNMYLTHSLDDSARPIMALRDTDDLWSFPAYGTTPISTGTVASVNADTTKINFASSVTDPSFPVGRYLVQFLTGPLTGTVRRVTALASDGITVESGWGSAPQVGVTFRVYQSTASQIGNLLSSGNLATLDARYVGFASGLLPKAYASFSGTTGAILSLNSLNVSSVTRYAVGQYQINLTAALRTANPVVSGSVGTTDTGGSSSGVNNVLVQLARTTTSIRVGSWDSAATAFEDPQVASVVVHESNG